METKNFKKTLGAGAAVVALSGFVPLPGNSAMAASDTATLNISANVLQQLTAVASTALAFGNFVVTGTGGKATVSTGGAISGSNANFISGHAAGGIKFGGPTGVAYNFSGTNMTNAGLKIDDGGVNDLTITKFTIGVNANGLQTAVNFSAGTAASKRTDTAKLQGAANAANPVGAAIDWTAVPAVASYSGALNVSISR